MVLEASIFSLYFPFIFFPLLLYTIYYFFFKPYPILLLGYSCYKPPDDRKCDLKFGEDFIKRTGRFSKESQEFMRLIYQKSGLGEETYAPPFIFQGLNKGNLDSAWLEAREGIFFAVDNLLSTAKIDPKDIQIVIITSGSFAPSPSLSSLLVNRYKMDSSVRTFNLSGMGCGSGILSTDMAAHLLRAGGRNVQNALIVAIETMTVNWYYGENRSMLVSNCIFRVGCAAALMTNDPSRRRDAKFQLIHSLRTHHGADDSSYNVAFQGEDEKGNKGVTLTKELSQVAGQNLRVHLTTLAPRVLPLSQLVKYVVSVALSVLTRGESKPMVPDFTTAFEHICVHTGGKAVIEQVAKVLKLADSVIEPARMTLHRFGNTSSSLVFYQLAYFDAKRRIKRGDRVWMLSFGTGFKVGSLVWKALKDSKQVHNNPWNDCIQRYPINKS